MARAIAKYIRMSPRKLRRVINVIRGKDISTAQVVLKFMPYAAARIVEKVLKSAIANAKENDKLNPDELKITKAYVDQSTTLRRWRAMSRGRGFPILKRTSHVTVQVDTDTDFALRKTTKPFKKPPLKVEDKKKDEGKHEHKHEHEEEHKHEHKIQKTESKTLVKGSKTKEVKDKIKGPKKTKEKKEKEE